MRMCTAGVLPHSCGRSHFQRSQAHTTDSGRPTNPCTKTYKFLEMCTHACAHTVHAHKHAPWRLIVLSVSRLSGMATDARDVSVSRERVCRCPWSVWIARASGCSQLWDACPDPRGALGAGAPSGAAGLAGTSAPRAACGSGLEGEGPQRQRSPSL